jgi:hypothetical protein
MGGVESVQFEVYIEREHTRPLHPFKTNYSISPSSGDMRFKQPCYRLIGHRVHHGRLRFQVITFEGKSS